MNKQVVLDIIDYDLLEKPISVATSNFSNIIYCIYWEHSKCIGIHRTIMERMLGRNLVDGELVDHINGNGLDNRRANLRVCTHQQNIFNQQKRKDKCSSKYKGVCWSKRNKSWLAQIRFNYKLIYLGYYKNEDDAGLAYNEKAKELFGEFARLNIIEETNYE